MEKIKTDVVVVGMGAAGLYHALHLPKELLGSTLRFSFCFDTTEEEIDYCLQELSELLPVLRRFVRR